MYCRKPSFREAVEDPRRRAYMPPSQDCDIIFAQMTQVDWARTLAQAQLLRDASDRRGTPMHKRSDGWDEHPH